MALAYNNRGIARASKGDYELAVQDYDQSIKLSPTFAKALTIAVSLTKRRAIWIAPSVISAWRLISLTITPAPSPTGPRFMRRGVTTTAH